ncbi:MAG: U32 family peptidase [Clostridia bacterium]|nr:U32 family peptidase [Clostridia bacterium]
MERFEILSPAGDIENFYEAINSGADAVYMGLSKFNARMKAGNISIEELSSIVRYAHIKGVKVYITLNTLVSDGEMKEVVSLVSEALRCGVDAFIVQDYGIIGELKARFPEIVLHGSTQLGVHNRYGAMIAKQMGLSRVVLSREVTLKDIKDIRENVDIELEVFVQGAMCVCFSGNCYLSSLKFGASGNRGECKQLCRLCYGATLADKEYNGYFLSPRDNCMIDYLSELVSLGVVSFKIEGRLRRRGYVGIATSVYRKVLDEVLLKRGQASARYSDEFLIFDKEKSNFVSSNKWLQNRVSNKSKTGSVEDFVEEKRLLQKVFSRGDFVAGYFDGNDVIDELHNSHMGELIGSVVSCKKFKDIYRIEIESSQPIRKGDGLKIGSDDSYISLGVGNVEINNNKYIVYGKNYTASKSEVYRILDSELESEERDLSLYRKVNIDIDASTGKNLTIVAECAGREIVLSGAECGEAKSRPITVENFTTVFDRLSNGFAVGSLRVNLGQNVFLPLSEIKAIKRSLEEKLLDIFSGVDSLEVESGLEVVSGECSLSGIAIIDDMKKHYDISNYDGVVYSPEQYSVEGLNAFIKTYGTQGKKLFLRLPIIAMVDDLNIIDKMVEVAICNGVALMCENIYGLYYVSQGAEVWAGAEMNLTNLYSLSYLKKMGVVEFVASIEKWNNRIQETYKLCKGNRVLMTMTHCPYKTINHRILNNTNLSCDKCLYAKPIKLVQENKSYYIRRYKVANCYFELVDSVCNNSSASHFVDDLRGVYV